MKSTGPKVCPICQSQAQLKWKDHIGYQSSKSYDIFHCPDCYTAYAQPLQVDFKVYDHIYQNLANIPGYDRYLKFADQVLKEADPLQYLADSEDVYWSILKHLSSISGRKLKILEVGCGFGYLTYALHKAGFDVLGVDISQVAIENAKKRYGPYYQCIELKDISDEKFDLVIFTEVLEHIEDAFAFLKEASGLVKRDGSILLTTPNRTPYPEDVLWETEPPPIHLYWFSEKSISLMAQKLRMTASYVDFTEFNLKEFERIKTIHQPDLRVRNFQPSRNPRLDENGKVIQEPKFLKVEYRQYPFKEALKSVMNSLGLLKPLSELKRKWLYCMEKRRERRIRNSLIKRPQKRPTMCAILRFK